MQDWKYHKELWSKRRLANKIERSKYLFKQLEDENKEDENKEDKNKEDEDGEDDEEYEKRFALRTTRDQLNYNILLSYLVKVQTESDKRRFLNWTVFNTNS